MIPARIPTKALGFLCLLFFSSLLAAAETHAETIAICTDQNYWYPYSYMENKSAKGMHIDIITKALARLGHQPVFTPLPWKRCLQSIENGRFNAVAGVSFKPDRSQYIFYPADAATAKESQWRITQVEYIVMVAAGDPYEFDGNPAGLPQPVMLPLGYSIVDDLQQMGVAVKTLPNTLKIIHELVRSQKGSAITPPLNAKALMKDPNVNLKVRANKLPFTSKSYFMGFSKNNPGVGHAKMQKIWDEIAAVRNDQAFMNQLNQLYDSPAEVKSVP